MSLNLSIKNFQSIKETNLDLSGFTVITGSSNLGKSAVRRAFATVIYNDWDKSYIRNGCDGAEIELERDGNIVRVEKEYKNGKSNKNTFCVNGKSYEKIGDDAVPDEYKGFGWLILKGKGKETYKLNIATQLEPLFMMGYKDTDNTTILNNAFKLDVFEKASAEAGREAKQFAGYVKVHETDLKAKEEELVKAKSELDRLESIKEGVEKRSADHSLIKEYMALKREYNSKKPEYEKLLLEQKIIELAQQYKFIENYVEKVKEREKARKVEEIATKVVRLLSLIDITKNYIEKVGELESKKEREAIALNAKEKISQLEKILSLIELKMDIEKKKEEIEKLQKEEEITIKVSKLLPAVDIVRNYIEKARELESKKKKETLILSAKEKISQLEKLHTLIGYKMDMNKAKEALEANKKELGEIDKEIHSLGICPLCQREL